VNLAQAAACRGSRGAAEKRCFGWPPTEGRASPNSSAPLVNTRAVFHQRKDVFLHWVNMQSMDSSRSMAYLTDNSSLLQAGQWIQINPARSNWKWWVHSSPHQASTDETNSYKLCPHRMIVECRINVINGLWNIKTGADEGVKYDLLLNSSEIRKFSPRSNLRWTERELSTIWYTITKAVLTSWKPVLSISRYYVFIS